MSAASATKCSFRCRATINCRSVGQPIRILTHLAVREDAHVLYGFMTPAERDLFRLLVNSVSGIGPKLALAVLSGMSVNNFKAAVVNSDVAAISKISGLGKKTAERIVLELKDKLGVAAAWEAASAAHAPTPEQEQANEAVLALIALGYKQADAHKAVHDLQQKGEGKGKSAEELVKLSAETNGRRKMIVGQVVSLAISRAWRQRSDCPTNAVALDVRCLPAVACEGGLRRFVIM